VKIFAQMSEYYWLPADPSKKVGEK